MQAGPGDSMEPEMGGTACFAEQASLCVTHGSIRTVSIHPVQGPAGGWGHPSGRGYGSAHDGGSAAGVHRVLGRLETAGQQQLGGVGGLDEQEVELLALGGGEVPEHEVGRVLPARRPADADADAEVVLGAAGAGDRAQAVVAALAAAALEPDGGERDVQLVVHDHQVGDVEVVVVEQAADRPAGLVHVGRRLGEDDAAPGQATLTGERAGAGALARGQPDAGAPGQLLQHHGADVVPVPRVAGPGVAEADDQEGALARCGRRGGAGGAGAPAGRAVGQRRPQLSWADFSAESIDSPLPWSSGSGTTSPSPAPSAASAEPSRSMPASASAASSSASRASAVGAPRKPMTSASGSVTSVAPAGSDRSPAVMFSPAVRPVTSTSIASGSRVASASIETVFSWWFGMASGPGSPITTTGTSTVVRSPRRTSSRSTCSCWRVSGSRWTDFVRASCSVPSKTTVSRALWPPLRSAAANSRAGRDRWTTSWPCP